MKTKYYFVNLTFVTLKKFGKDRAEKILENIRSFAMANGYVVAALNGGYVMSWNLAKNFARYLHFDCARCFDFNEAMEMCDKNIVSLADVENAKIA